MHAWLGPHIVCTDLNKPHVPEAWLLCFECLRWGS